MTATLSQSQAILKILYPDGELPKAVHKSFPTWDKLAKKTNFKGEAAYVALQNENPQGSSADFSTAVGSLYQGTYNRYQLTRVTHYGIARIKGEALEAATMDEGALVALWENETKGIATTEVKCHAIYFFGNGSGVLGQVSSGQGGATLTMTTDTNMNYFDLNMRVGGVSTNTLSPTIRTGAARVTGIDRVNRTLTTTGGNWNVQLNGLGANEYLTRAGDQASGGTATVDWGIEMFIEGGASPGALGGLTRTSDPVRLAGQTLSAAGMDMGDALTEASALAGFQGVGYPDVVIMNNREAANWKKSLEAKRIYNDGQKSGSVGFSKLMFEGENGPVEVIADPFAPRNKTALLKWDAFSYWSLGAAPHIKADDKNQWLRVATDDAVEVRFASYGNNKVTAFAPCVRITSFGT